MLQSSFLKTCAVLIAAVVANGCGSAPVVVSNSGTPAAAPASAGQQGELKLKAPDGWQSERPTSSMRVSQYQLPAAEGDSEPGSLVVLGEIGQKIDGLRPEPGEGGGFDDHAPRLQPNAYPAINRRFTEAILDACPP